MRHKLQQYLQEFAVTGVTFDSRNIKAGDAFFALKGENFDGNEYIDKALEKGAVVAFTDIKSKQSDKVIYVEDIRLELALAAGMLYPSLPKNIVAVTGTNGKSSVISYVHQIMVLLGRSSCTLGTLGIESSEKLDDKLTKDYPKQFTTADPVSLRRILHSLADCDIENVAFEASSHGLHQKRLGDIKVKSAAFTSFSQDHLEYHQTFENYLYSKLTLFTENLAGGGKAVISSEITYFDFIIKFLQENSIEFITVGINGDLTIKSCKQSLSGQEVCFAFGNSEYKFKTDIIGSFQASNILIAAMLVHNLGHSFTDIAPTLSKLKAVNGRLERITKQSHEFQIFVDYAHTPDALEKTLLELKSLKVDNSRLVVVFGCGGNRDKEKRPLMGKIARKIADKVIVTDDNPRLEDSAKIRQEIIHELVDVTEIGDRKKAINTAIKELGKSDILLIAGKGHEDYQIISSEKKHFSDKEVATKCLEGLTSK